MNPDAVTTVSFFNHTFAIVAAYAAAFGISIAVAIKYRGTLRMLGIIGAILSFCLFIGYLVEWVRGAWLMIESGKMTL